MSFGLSTSIAVDRSAGSEKIASLPTLSRGIPTLTKNPAGWSYGPIRPGLPILFPFRFSSGPALSHACGHLHARGGWTSSGVFLAVVDADPPPPVDRRSSGKLEKIAAFSRSISCRRVIAPRRAHSRCSADVCAIHFSQRISESIW